MAPKTAQNGPVVLRVQVRSGVLRRPNCMPGAPNPPQSSTDPVRGPPGLAWGRSGLLGTRLAMFWPRFGSGPSLRGVGGPPGAKDRV